MKPLRLAALALLAVLFVYPLANLLALPLLTGARGISCWPALANSAAFALIAGLLAAITGTLLAQALETLTGRIARLLDLGLWLLFLTPGYVLTTGWLVILANPAVRNSLFGQVFLGRAGLVYLYTLKALPFAVFVARATFASAGAGLAEAASVLNVAPWRRRMLRLRLALPAIASAFAIAAIETMQEFGIPATLGLTSRIPILTYAIYQRLNTTPTDFAGAAALCWWLIGAAGLLTVLQLAVQRRYQAALVHGRSRKFMRKNPASGQRALLGAALGRRAGGTAAGAAQHRLRRFGHGYGKPGCRAALFSLRHAGRHNGIGRRLPVAQITKKQLALVCRRHARTAGGQHGSAGPHPGRRLYHRLQQ
jgi:iron(III) transport system permease protein